MIRNLQPQKGNPYRGVTVEAAAGEINNHGITPPPPVGDGAGRLVSHAAAVTAADAVQQPTVGIKRNIEKKNPRKLGCLQQFTIQKSIQKKARCCCYFTLLLLRPPPFAVTTAGAAAAVLLLHCCCLLVLLHGCCLLFVLLSGGPSQYNQYINKIRECCDAVCSSLRSAQNSI